MIMLWFAMMNTKQALKPIPDAPSPGTTIAQEKVMAETVAPHPRPSFSQLAVATSEAAITLVNRWLHRDVGMVLNVSSATFNPETFCWHLPIHLAYGATRSLGIVGDVYVQAATGVFIGAPDVTDLQHRAEALAAAHGIPE